MTEPFTGSYTAEQTTFLLQPLDMPDTTVVEKERLIQSGARHYSELLTREGAPDAAYEAIFVALTERYRARLAGEINALALAMLAERRDLTVVSLARAGTPIGALLVEAIRRLGGTARHFSVSIILGRGIDEAALAHILRVDHHAPESVRFVDGWTAKGSIGRELDAAIAQWNAANPEQLDPRLHVVVDLGGTAAVSATLEDYAVPCGILGATVSGLVSRTVRPASAAPCDLHGCVYYRELLSVDKTQWFYESIAGELAHRGAGRLPSLEEVAWRRRATDDFVRHTMRLRGIDAVNRIKPGVTEATRALLRRNAERLLIRDPTRLDVAHLLLLAERLHLPVEREESMPFDAVTLIRRVHV